MGSLYTPGKNEYFWSMLSYLQDDNVYDNDRRVVPYTPSTLQTFADLYPTLSIGTVLFVYINGIKVSQGQVINADGFFSAKVSVPLGDFTLTVRDSVGNTVRQQLFVGKNYATFLEISAQSYEERRVAIQQVKEDLDFSTIRSEKLYPVIGVLFDFPPPPGWPVDMYRNALIGDGGGCPGFTSSFFKGGTLQGIIDTIKSITCSTVTVSPVQNGERWVIFDAADAPSPTDPTSPDGWFLSDADNVPEPNKRILVMDGAYPYSTVRLTIADSARVVVNENVLKGTDSFIESPRSQAYVLNGKTLSFSVEEVGDPSTKSVYATTFGASTTAAQAASDILAQNPTLTSAVYASGGRLRIGISPEAAKVKRITVISGTSLSEFGFIAGISADVAPDTLSNPYPTTAVSLTFGIFTYVQGVDFTIVQNTGEIVWVPSNAVNTTIPPKGSLLLASYTYQMRREIFSMVDKVKQSNIDIEYVFS